MFGSTISIINSSKSKSVKNESRTKAIGEKTKNPPKPPTVVFFLSQTKIFTKTLWKESCWSSAPLGRMRSWVKQSVWVIGIGTKPCQKWIEIICRDPSSSIIHLLTNHSNKLRMSFANKHVAYYLMFTFCSNLLPLYKSCASKKRPLTSPHKAQGTASRARSR